MRNAARILLWVVVCLLAGTLPGTSLVVVQGLAEEKAPAVPDSHGPRDARLDVVVKSDGGQYVHDAYISAYLMIARRAYHAATVTSDEAGVARLLTMPRGEHYVVVSAKGYAQKSTMVVLEPGARRLDVTLTPEHTLDVVVEDETHARLAGAVVEVSAGDPVPVGARAGDDGAAHVVGLPSGPYRVRVDVAGFEAQTKSDAREGEPCIATMSRLGALDVTVKLGDGAPAAHATVSIASITLFPSRAAETDAAGHVRIAGLSPGSYALRAALGAEISTTELSVSLARGEVKPVALVLGRGASAEIVVHDSESDEPLAGARVTLAEGGISPFPLEAVTNKDGRAVLGPFATGRAVVTVQKDGYVSSRSLEVPEDGSPLRVSLGRGASIEGRVVDARGFPIDGASFVVVGTDVNGGPIDDDPRARRFSSAHFASALAGPAPLVAAGELGVMPGPVPPIPHGQGEAALATAPNAPGFVPDEPWVSKRDGTFTISPVTPGRVRILARHPEYTDAFGDVIAVTPGALAHADIVMHRGGSIEGRVVDARGRGVAGAEVSALATHGSMEREARTASDGTFAFAAMPETVTLLVADASEPGEPLARAVVTVTEGRRTEVSIALPEPRAPLQIHVTDDRGRGLSQAIVTAASADENEALHATGFADDNGDLTIPRAQGIALRLDVRAPAFASSRVLVAPRREPLRIAMAPAVVVTGIVTSARGEPLALADVTAYAEVSAMHAQTDRDGAFRFTELGAGTVRIGARKAGFAPTEAEVKVTLARAGRAFEAPKLVLAEEGVVTGKVQDDAGKPVAGARIAKDVVSTYVAVGAASAAGAVSGKDGTFRLGELPAGDYSLEALLADVGRGTVAVHVEPGHTTRDAVIVIAKSDEDAAREHAAGGVAVTLGETAEPVEVVLVAVAAGSEAERAGLLPRDVLVDVDGARVETMKDARAPLRAARGRGRPPRAPRRRDARLPLPARARAQVARAIAAACGR